MKAPSGAVQWVKLVRGTPVRFDYAGGAYIEITFGSAAYRPTEVINVWDYEKGEAEIPFTLEAIKAQANAWIKGMEDPDDENDRWDSWLEDYIANA